MKREFFLLFVIIGLVSVLAYAQDQFPFLGEITSDRVVIRSGQHTNFERLGLLQKGAQVVVVDKDYSWYKIKLPVHARSYISIDFVKELGESIGEVTGTRVNIRSGAGTNFIAVGQLKKGQHVRILQRSSDKWYKIEPAEGMWGWVLAEYVKLKSTEIPSPRIVKPPIRNIYVKKRLAAQKKAEEQKRLAAIKAKEEEERKKRLAIVTGVIEDLGSDSVSDNIRHKIVVDGKEVYFLKGYRKIIDWFLNHKVMLEGEKQPDIKSPYPVILVTKINLVL